MKVYTIPSHLPFVDCLARGIMERYGKSNPLSLSSVTILLPTRRAVRGLRDAFLRTTNGTPTILPVMRAIGDIDEDILALEGVGDSALGQVADIPESPDVPPAVSPLYRQFALSQLIMAWWQKQGRAAHPAQALQLSQDLAKLIDAVHTNDLDFGSLERLVPDDYAVHWQATLQFLEIATDAWPCILAERNQIDPADRRKRLTAMLADSWREKPPERPVIAAGSTGSIPATAELLAVVADLPAGQVILPGLDRDLEDDAWQGIDDTHPQSALKRLIEKFGIDRNNVGDWPLCAQTSQSVAAKSRVRFLSDAMRPAIASNAWTMKRHGQKSVVQGLARIDCPDTASEAVVIALLMRKVLDTPGEQAALVTSDRVLAHRVISELSRWSVVADDSAGMPLAQTPAARFLRQIASAFAESAAPIPLLAMLKHPLATGGEAPGSFRAHVRAMERLCLRGPRLSPGFRTIGQALSAKGGNEVLLSWWQGLEKHAAQLEDMMALEQKTVTELLLAHVAFAEWLTGELDDGGSPLWAGDSGEALAALIDDIVEDGASLPSIKPTDFPEVLDSLMSGRIVRPSFGLHPRLHIWGPLEARLQHVDLLILGGLNEGTWPREPTVDPWLSRPMRAAFGLPPPERMIGLSAHDFGQLCAAPRVVLTRAEKEDGTPTVPSRWLVRLSTAAKGQNLQLDNAEEFPAKTWLSWASNLDRPDAVVKPVLPPEPRPPLSARPRELSVTRVETLMRDPYQIYARYILSLKPLQLLDEPLSPAQFGSVVHNAIEAFFRGVKGGDLPANSKALLEQAGLEAFSTLGRNPMVKTYWWPRFVKLADWLIAQETERAPQISERHIEIEGAIDLSGPGGDFRLTARADRIDSRVNGEAAVIDYKTGVLPSGKEVVAGFAPQLPLEAAILLDGGFNRISNKRLARLEYWKLGGARDGGEIKAVNDDPHELAREAIEGLENLVTKFDDSSTPYLAQPVQGKAPRYSDYEHLARVREWMDSAGDDSE